MSRLGTCFSRVTFGSLFFFLRLSSSFSAMNCERIPEPQIELLHPMSRGLWVVSNAARWKKLNETLSNSNCFCELNFLRLVVDVTMLSTV